MAKRKQRAFIMKYQYFYSDFNHGKTGKASKKNRRCGKKKMRKQLEKEMKEMC